jgi:ABC-type molybdate transport system permease subunit
MARLPPRPPELPGALAARRRAHAAAGAASVGNRLLRGLVAAAVLAFARAVGEFGATLIFAGNIPGRTNTMPLEIYSAYQVGDDARALALVGVLSAVSLAVVLVSNRFGRATWS